jgi:peptidoglycan/LPS O-acetylase OafA/YrhL
VDERRDDTAGAGERHSTMRDIPGISRTSVIEYDATQETTRLDANSFANKLKPVKTDHLNFVDGLRALAALLVVTHHAWLQSWPYNLYPQMRPAGRIAILTSWLAFGKIAVTAFIVISGYCLMLPIVRSVKDLSASDFYSRRCRRILPPYYAALALALMLDYFFLKQRSGTEYDAGFPITLSGLISHLLLTQNFSANPFEIDGPLWSIAVEFQIYAFFPAFILIYRRWGILPTLALTSLSGYLASYLFSLLGFENTYTHYIVMFGFGMGAAHFAFRWLPSKQNTAVLMCYLSFPALAFAGVALHHWCGSNKLVIDSVVGLLVANTLLVATIKPNGLAVRLLSARILVFVGSFSYSLYLIHSPLQQLLWQLIAEPRGWSRLVTFVVMATAGTASIVVMAFGFFCLFERPYLGRRAFVVR